MDAVPDIQISDYSYALPQERIAQYPLPERDTSKLLIYQSGILSSDKFYNLTEYLPKDALMVFNETRVIQARLIFHKPSGARIEIFCLEPVRPTREIQQAFEQTSGVVWKCLIGNSKKWKSGTLEMELSHKNESYRLFAHRLTSTDDHSLVSFQWTPSERTFSEVLTAGGDMPLPPYMKREAEASDTKRYQTIYARNEGSVAAPTAGLHFTTRVFEELRKKNIRKLDVTLHVGAGTFKPVSAENIRSHEMHTEQIVVSKKTLVALARQKNPVVAVGTTSMRTLESIYWHGVKLLTDPEHPMTMNVGQWDPYLKKYNKDISVQDSLKNLIDRMDSFGINHLSGQTQLIILPGYEFKLVDVLLTNFHMPRSTLLLLVAAFIGDAWKKAYTYALENNFRFLSYGDACLFYKEL
jgi:S-adenosylmethionine:tRNA ribosyltransferase-isomerase